MYYTILTAHTGDAPFIGEEQASFNVDALVNENDNEPEPTIPHYSAVDSFFDAPRRATPTVPPGFTAPATQPAKAAKPVASVVPVAPVAPASTDNQKLDTTIKAAPSSKAAALQDTPSIPVPSTPPPKTRKSKHKASTAEPATPIASIAAKHAPQTPKSRETGDIALKPQTPVKTAAKTTGQESGGAGLSQRDIKSTPKEVTVQTPKSRGGKKSRGISDVSVKEDLQKRTKAISVSEGSPLSSNKRQPPSKLDIVAATKVTENDKPTAGSSATKESQAKSSSLPSANLANSVPPSPAAAATGSPAKRTTAPRTLRVIPTPKTEVPPILSAASTTPLPQMTTVEKLRSRQASIASVNLPGTPVSELVSDSASITSTSISRANSPPPIGSKVGTAPVRSKTKSQAKKDRQERKRQIEEEQTVMDENKSDVEVIQAPIIGRKKKTKRPANITKPAPAVSKSQPPSPKPATVEEETSDAPMSDSKISLSAKPSATATPEPEPAVEQAKDGRELSAQAIMADLQRTGELVASSLEFFKPLASSLTHASRHMHANKALAPPDLKIHFSAVELDALGEKKIVRLKGIDGKPDTRTLITPGGKFFWGLSEELEQKALDLEKKIEKMKGQTRFHPRPLSSRTHNSGSAGHGQSQDVLPTITTALKEAGKKLNTSSSQPIPKFDQSGNLIGSNVHSLDQETNSAHHPPPLIPQPQTPADAGMYLNQFVLPKTDNPPPNQPRPEMAAVGGPPGAGTANISINGNNFVKAARAVIEGGAVGSTEVDGMGIMTPDLLGGVFVQGLESLVGAGLGFQSTQEFGLDGNGNVMDNHGFAHGFESTSSMSGGARRGRGSVLSVEEAEQAMQAARKEHEVLEKRLAALIKKNKKLAFGSQKI